MTAGPSWEAWAPPLAPPTDGGLPVDEAQAIADAWWDDEPHLCAALQWEAYAATLPPALAVAQVSTGMQSVSLRAGHSRRGAGRGDNPRPVAPVVPADARVGSAAGGRAQSPGFMPLVRPCRNRRCPEYAGRDGWCDAHRKPMFWRAEPLPPGWASIRAGQLARFPSCWECGAPATEVHHVRGRAAGHGPDNLRASVAAATRRSLAGKAARRGPEIVAPREGFG